MKNKYERLRVVDEILVQERSELLHQLPPLATEHVSGATRQHHLLAIGELTVLLSEVREHRAALEELENICYRQADPEIHYPDEKLYGELITTLTLGLYSSLAFSPGLQTYLDHLPEKVQATLDQVRDQQLALLNPDDENGLYQPARVLQWRRQHGEAYDAGQQRNREALHALRVTYPEDMQRVLTLAQTQGSFQEIFALLD
ncbi:hypothetical protein [Hymenobacter crusticola]|uniref:Uncharacterized protein n=1 Tax=Hymenobacter crusticola TaxID=1770526 RepID=A0A243W5D5_9BACT|nr:hypothetical protein [Hymenobacter crusticola]OUJ68048.1 hypothetical protein BXP70_28165 [Hymenobacter crusticola]